MGIIRRVLLATTVLVLANPVTTSFAMEQMTIDDHEAPVVQVTDIELSGYKEILKVKEEINLTATILPINATAQAVEFCSLDSSIATVSSTGKVTGVAAGSTDIIAEVGGYKKTVRIVVKVPTEKIIVNRNYIIMKVGESTRLQIHVLPALADQSIELRSNDSSIVAVTNSGLITAKRLGSASIIVKTWDTSRVINVIVNCGGSSNEDTAPEQGNSSAETNEPSNSSDKTTTKTNDLINALLAAADGHTIIVKGNELPLVTTELLKALLGTKKKLTIQQGEYEMSLTGTDIVNTRNELKTEIAFFNAGTGLEFMLNDGKGLPGRIEIKYRAEDMYNYIYIYNDSFEAYAKLNAMLDVNSFYIDTSGKYLLCKEQLPSETINWLLLLPIFIVFGVAGLSYVATRRRHWFW
jgi:uncharacterized protein YjdB